MWGALAAVSLLWASIPLVFAASPSETAQSIMVSVTPDYSAYQIEGTLTWTYHRDLAMELYTAYDGVWDGNEPTCNGSATNCASTNKPGVPAAPAISTRAPDSVSFHAQADRCIFFFGGTVSGWDYTQTETVKGKNETKGNWTFTYNYHTDGAGYVAAGTYWTSLTEGKLPDPSFDGFVSSESYVKAKNFTKYSFTLLESPTLENPSGSRVQNVIAQLQHWDTVSSTWVDVGIPIVYDTPLPVTATAVDYIYYGNGGAFGKTSAKPYLHAPGGLDENWVSEILLADTFVNNDNDLASGNIHEADISGQFFDLSEEGDYRVVVSGTLKGNTASGVPDAEFSVEGTLTFVGGCTRPPTP